jgi:hypothetical protein
LPATGRGKKEKRREKQESGAFQIFFYFLSSFFSLLSRFQLIRFEAIGKHELISAEVVRYGIVLTFSSIVSFQLIGYSI